MSPGSQRTHVPPFRPQAKLLVPAVQLEPFQHPVQHAPEWHVPPVQLLVLLRCTQRPPLPHESVVQGLPSSQLAHSPPPAPHVAVDVPALQLPPLMQPAHTLTQLPPEQESLVSTSPSSQLTQATPPVPHAVREPPDRQLPLLVQPEHVFTHSPPLLQESEVTGLLSSQFEQLPPPDPHALVEEPVTHVEPFMQPAHVCVQVPLLHRSEVSGLASSHCESAVHCTQEPPEQRGVEPPQETQVSPAAPHEEVEDPERQLGPSAQPAQQLPATHCPAEPPMVQAPVIATLRQVPPPAQLSRVQALPSLQSEALVQPTQRAPDSSQLVVPPQGSPAWLEQLPALHVSTPLQNVPSSQRRLLLACAHPVVAAQLSSVQALPSSHAPSSGMGSQPAAPQRSAVQSTPSSHALSSCVCRQPMSPQLSTVQATPSSQPAATQAPAQHISPLSQILGRTQALPSQWAVWQPAVGAQVLASQEAY